MNSNFLSLHRTGFFLIETTEVTNSIAGRGFFSRGPGICQGGGCEAPSTSKEIPSPRKFLPPRKFISRSGRSVRFRRSAPRGGLFFFFFFSKLFLGLRLVLSVLEATAFEHRQRKLQNETGPKKKSARFSPHFFFPGSSPPGRV